MTADAAPKPFAMLGDPAAEACEGDACPLPPRPASTTQDYRRTAPPRAASQRGHATVSAPLVLSSRHRSRGAGLSPRPAAR
ncbi:hypothetical protein FHX53_000507 [Yonghaparkia alkaliphila]|uniref:Uncharacterized protein n=1 Tax=Microcella alkalica TaxID=355930 RepID=A0A839E729_9MICO|nr:hypothetical protein [Microcella alkalica]